MDSSLDPDMIRVAQLLWPQPQQLEAARGGLFNRVLKVSMADGCRYLKRFTDSADAAGERMGVSYPPLPTRAAQRCLVACAWHDLALRACANQPAGAAPVRVPALLAIQTELDMVAMDAAAGAPLQPLLQADAEGAPAAARLLPPIIRWLAALHAQPLQPREALLAASRPFKAYKIDLQYVQMLGELPSRLHAASLRFISRYLTEEEEPVHGDLNSRNLLIGDGSPWVIDFEQGHFGAGVYDLAYLLSEYVIQALDHHADPLSLAARAWTQYRDARSVAWASAHTPANAEREHERQQRDFQIHLAFQVLYRLVGPSRQVWTGHLDAQAARRVHDWSVTALELAL